MDKENRHMYRNPRPLSAWRAGLTAAALAGAVGCGPMHYIGVSGGPTLLNVRLGVGPTMATETMATPAVAERLARLRAERGTGRSYGDYVLGRGDLMSIRAFDFDQLNQHVRVESDGSIRLPLLNTVAVAGRTVSEVEQELTRRLGERLLMIAGEYGPTFDVTVRAANRLPGAERHIIDNYNVPLDNPRVMMWHATKALNLVDVHGQPRYTA